MEAPGMTAPVGSETVPTMRARSACASREILIATKTMESLIIRSRITPLCYKRMNIELKFHYMIGNHFETVGASHGRFETLITVKNTSFLRGSKIGLGFNNLFDNHNIVAISPATPGNG